MRCSVLTIITAILLSTSVVALPAGPSINDSEKRAKNIVQRDDAPVGERKAQGTSLFHQPPVTREPTLIALCQPALPHGSPAPATTATVHRPVPPRRDRTHRSLRNMPQQNQKMASSS
ncbi:hypothetical protein EX30DRAFT_344072 [Ascodesmis nigricans]|uniref:Uncharacterized protein n=1 Tax=Ascodesmis nigricans TaxID=341454 RepID=A0A4S2MQ25_9PEZI|nr:hypothetical protein EX30DRAFT_344072 [Ascodesmis nigricans]